MSGTEWIENWGVKARVSERRKEEKTLDFNREGTPRLFWFYYKGPLIALLLTARRVICADAMWGQKWWDPHIGDGASFRLAEIIGVGEGWDG